MLRAWQKSRYLHLHQTHQGHHSGLAGSCNKRERQRKSVRVIAPSCLSPSTNYKLFGPTALPTHWLFMCSFQIQGKKIEKSSNIHLGLFIDKLQYKTKSFLKEKKKENIMKIHPFPICVVNYKQSFRCWNIWKRKLVLIDTINMVGVIIETWFLWMIE